MLNQQDRRLEKTCVQCAEEAFISRINNLRAIYKAKPQNTVTVEKLLKLDKYGLTTINSTPFYISYLLSSGNPEEEFRIYKNGKVEFLFSNLACSRTKIDISSSDAEIIKAIVDLIDCWQEGKEILGRI